MARGKKIRRKGKALAPRKGGHNLTISPRDAVILPLINSIALLSGYLIAPECSCDGCPVSELLNEICVAMQIRIGRTFGHAGTIGKTFRQVKPLLSENSSRDFQRGFPHDDDMPSTPSKPEAIEAGKRLRRTREALGFATVRRFSQIVDEDESKLTKYENGIVMVPPRVVSKLRQKYGVDHNWIFDNDMSRLPHDLVEKLIAKDEN